MTIEVDADGYFRHVWAKNKAGDTVFPHIKGMKGTTEKGISVTLTSDKSDYHIVSVERFVDYIVSGKLDGKGRVRMKNPDGTQSNGFSVISDNMSAELKARLATS